MTYFLVYLTGHLIFASPLPSPEVCAEVQHGYHQQMGKDDPTSSTCEQIDDSAPADKVLTGEPI